MGLKMRSSVDLAKAGSVDCLTAMLYELRQKECQNIK